jgi:DNA-binding transcriptional ArsR family regulator
MVKLASVKLGVRERGDPWTPSLHNETIDALDERGIEHDYDTHEYVSVLPIQSPLRSLNRESPTKENVGKRVRRRISRAYINRCNALIDAPMSSGKSTGAIIAAAETETKIFIVMPRGRNEGYDYIKSLCDEEGLSSEVLPSSHEMCNSLNGEHGDGMEERLKRLMSCGITLKECHAFLDLPCDPNCLSWDDVNTNADVLIGHYKHLNAPSVMDSRIVVVDESPSEFASTFDDPESITKYLQRHDELLFENYTDLLGNRDDLKRTIPSLAWLDGEPMRNPELALDGIHASTPTMVYTILESTMEVGNEGDVFERTSLPNGNTALYNAENGEVSILSPPDLSSAAGVVALDGTPNHDKWEASLGVPLEHEEILDEEEWEKYLIDTMNYTFVVTTEATKPYNSVSNVNIREDAALLSGVHEEFGKPIVITTLTAENEYIAEGNIMEHIKDYAHPGDLKSSNRFKDEEVAVVIGANHPGDHEILKWAAFCDLDAHSPDRSKPENRGSNLSYGEEADEIYRNMVHDNTLQAAMRINREGEGGIVFIHTNTLPEKVPAPHVPGIVSTWSPGMREVIEVTKGMDGWTTSEVAQWTDISERSVRLHLKKLYRMGKVEKSKKPDDGRVTLWTRAEDIDEYGTLDLDETEYGWKVSGI